MIAYANLTVQYTVSYSYTKYHIENTTIHNRKTQTILINKCQSTIMKV